MTRSLRIAFLGNDRWSVPSLEALADSPHELVLVQTAEPKPAGRGNEPRPTPVALAARARRLPLAQVATVRDGAGFERLAAARPDVLAVVAYGELLPARVLGLPTLAPVNLHFSLLPALRGASPVQTALLLGLEETGVTTIQIDEGLDTGPILLRRSVAIAPEDDAGTLGERLAEIGGGLLVETVDKLATGDVEPRAQRDELATFAPRIRREDRVLDWTKAAATLVNVCRALAPDPAATTTFRGSGLKVLRAATVDASGEPGRIASVSKDGVIVGTSAGGFRPLELAPAGRRRMSAADFVNGYRPRVGERFG